MLRLTTRKAQSISSADRSIERAVARSVFPSDRECPTATDDASLDWYHHWLQERIEQLPSAVTKRIRSFPAVFCKVAVLTKSKCSINEIAASLPRSDMLETPDTDDDRRLLTCVVFALLGWQTMLYEPALGIAPPQQLAVADVLDGFSSQALTSLKQDCSQARRSLPDFLLGFGLMLPRGNLCMSEDHDERDAFEKTAVVGSRDLNAALLHSLARVTIKWVDVMAPHLELDKATNTLFLYRYPSFCLANIQPYDGVGNRGVIHGCAAGNDSPSEWACEAEVTQLLREIILSYRLLFGQSKASRRLFQPKTAFGSGAPKAQDAFLTRLCSDG
ncbi:hypothetical protein LTR16_003033, partial [Cryomyces antarcticus]